MSDANANADALDASVVDHPAPDTATAAEQAESARAAAAAKVEKQRAHLAGAEQGLAEAEAALAALTSGA